MARTLGWIRRALETSTACAIDALEEIVGVENNDARIPDTQ